MCRQAMMNLQEALAEAYRKKRTKSLSRRLDWIFEFFSERGSMIDCIQRDLCEFL